MLKNLLHAVGCHNLTILGVVPKLPHIPCCSSFLGCFSTSSVGAKSAVYMGVARMFVWPSSALLYQTVPKYFRMPMKYHFHYYWHLSKMPNWLLFFISLTQLLLSLKWVLLSNTGCLWSTSTWTSTNSCTQWLYGLIHEPSILAPWCLSSNISTLPSIPDDPDDQLSIPSALWENWCPKPSSPLYDTLSSLVTLAWGPSFLDSLPVAKLVVHKSCKARMNQWLES